jgi:Uma2 family endonuclease
MEITSLSQLDFSQQYTYSEYVLWHLNDRIELLKGYIRQMAAPNRKHQRTSLALSSVFYYTFKNHTCRAYAAPFDVRLPKKNPTGTKPKDIYTVVQPDICVICDLTKLDDAGCLGSPDLIVEILSPSNFKVDVFDKFKIYEEAGVREYWIANPIEKYIQQFVLNESSQQYELLNFATEQLTAAIFPSLVVNVAEVFED